MPKRSENRCLKRKHLLEYPVLVKKGNALIHAIGHPNIMATRLLLFALSKIRMMDGTNVPDQKLYDRIRRERGIDFGKGLVAAFSSYEFRQYLPGRNGNFKNAMLFLANVPSPKDLIHNWVVNLPSSDGTYVAGAVAVITATYYDEKSDMIFIKFNEEDAIKKELYALTERYTLLDFRQEMRFHSVYSSRLYELLLSEVGIDNARNRVRQSDTYTFRFGLKRLEYLLGTCYIKEGVSTEEYSRLQAMFIGARTDEDFVRIFEAYKDYTQGYKFNDFWRKCIMPALSEINGNPNIPYTIEAVAERPGRSVTSIVFKITRDQTSDAPMLIVSDNDLMDENPSAFTASLQWLDEHDVYGLNEQQKTALAAEADNDIHKLETAYAVAGQTEVDAPAAFLIKAIRDGYQPRKPQKKTYRIDDNNRTPASDTIRHIIEALRNTDYRYECLSTDDLLLFAGNKHLFSTYLNKPNASLHDIAEKIRELDQADCAGTNAD